MVQGRSGLNESGLVQISGCKNLKLPENCMVEQQVSALKPGISGLELLVQ